MKLYSNKEHYLVKLEPTETKVGGLLIPETDRKRPQVGTIVGVPEDYTGNKEVGMKAYIPEGVGVPIKYKEEEYLSVRDLNIVAYLK